MYLPIFVIIMTTTDNTDSGIYCIYWDIRPNDYYIGRSINLNVRKQEHLSALARNSHYNLKLQNYYNKFGIPNIEILEYAKPEVLKELEIQYINEFNSFKDGLNLTNGGENCGFGEGNSFSKFKEADYLNVLDYLANTNLSTREISNITGVTRDVIKHISGGTSHSYLQELCPDNYRKVKEKKYTRDNSAYSRGITYPILISPDNIEYTISNIHLFCREHGLQAQNLHKVLTKQRKVHKGWKIKE